MQERACDRWGTQTTAIDIAEQNGEATVSPPRGGGIARGGGDFKRGQGKMGWDRMGWACGDRNSCPDGYSQFACSKAWVSHLDLGCTFPILCERLRLCRVRTRCILRAKSLWLSVTSTTPSRIRATAKQHSRSIGDDLGDNCIS